LFYEQNQTDLLQKYYHAMHQHYVVLYSIKMDCKNCWIISVCRLYNRSNITLCSWKLTFKDCTLIPLLCPDVSHETIIVPGQGETVVNNLK